VFYYLEFLLNKSQTDFIDLTIPTIF